MREDVKSVAVILMFLIILSLTHGVVGLILGISLVFFLFFLRILCGSIKRKKERSKFFLRVSCVFLLVFVFAWAPWLDDQAIHDKVLKEKGWKDGTIVTVEHFKNHFKNLPEEILQELLRESREKGIKNGVLICDYKVHWFPFGRVVVSCEGAYYVTFWGQIIP